jgi:Helix-turn-helix domain
MNTTRTFLPTKEAAKFLDLSPRTLEKMRVQGRGPVFRKLGSRVVYAHGDLIAWANAGSRRSTSDSGPDQHEAA